MRLTTLFILFILSESFYGQDFSEYDLKPYNHDLKFKILNENDILVKDDSLQALIIIFNKPIYQNAELTISNNPQLKEIKLFSSNQDLLNFISELKLQKLTHLFFERYKDSILEIPCFPLIEHLTIQSTELLSLNMTNSSLNKLSILDMDVSKLKHWNTAISIPYLELIDLKAISLDYFPIENMPEIYQFSYDCSFKKLPINLCNYKNLEHLSFNNYCQIQIDKCIKKKIKKAYYSNLTVYDRAEGKVISEILSKDRRD